MILPPQTGRRLLRANAAKPFRYISPIGRFPQAKKSEKPYWTKAKGGLTIG
jgi:hypothetical protein